MLTQYQLAALQMAHPRDATIFCAIYSLPGQEAEETIFHVLSIQTECQALPSC